MSLNAKITSDQAAQWGKGSTEQGANESHDLAVSVVYAGLPVSGPPPKLDAAYVERGEKVINEQLQRGGIRLAAMLNRCLANDH